MEDIIVEAHKRTETGKNAARRLRSKDFIPAVIYGEKRDVRSIAVNSKNVLNILKSDSGENTLFHVVIEGETTRSAVMIKEYQLDPVSGKLLHVDLIRVSMKDLIKVKVPIVHVGECEGVKTDGGIIDFVMREVEVECFPADIPEHFAANITELRAGEVFRLKDLQVDEKIKILDDLELPILHIILPREEIEEVPEEEAEVTEEAAEEPEVIGKGKTRDEEETEESKS